MSDSRALDRQSRQRIRESLLENILVEAGAGSGKTQMLAERMAAGVAAGVYQVEHMAAVTFTRKAASELRGRFHLALEGSLKQALVPTPGPSPDPARIARLQDALSNLERFFAGTIHSFCARLLRERPVESGVSPGFTELDEVQDLELRQRVWREFVTAARADGDADMTELLAADIRPRDLDSAFATVCENDDVEFPAGEGSPPDPKPAWKALQEFWKKLQAHLPSPIDADTTCKVQIAAGAFRAQLRVSARRLERPSVMAALLGTWDLESKIIQKWWADSTAEKKRLAGAIGTLHADFHAAVVEPYLTQWRQYIYRLSIRLLTRARVTAEAERRRLNSLNYGDLLNLTARVLRQKVDVRRALQQKFQFLLVDEFQDTDPVQAEIVFWLAEAASPEKSGATGASETPADWRTVPLRPGALFVVGDPKQSIYRFRRADIDVYNIVRQRFSDPAVGAVLPLTRNFRSAPQLCDWVNTVFKTRFPVEPTAHAPRFASLDPDAARKPGAVMTLTLDGDKAADVPPLDAAAIASYIRAEVDAGRRRYSDFLILTRKKKSIGVYADALETLNVPVEVSGAGAFGKSREVAALTMLLRALADPQDQLALIAVLRGPLFGVSDPELFSFKQSGGWFSLFQQAVAADSRGLDSGVGRQSGAAGTDSRGVRLQPDHPVRSALESLNRYYRWTRVLPAAGALERILEDSGYLALAATTPGGVDAGDIIHAVDRVRQVVEAGGSLADAADALEADRDATSEVESLPLEPGRTDVVRLMNLHKAKGLEADVVFLAEPISGAKAWVDLHIERTGLNARGWLKIIRKSEGSFAELLIGEHADWAAHQAAELPYVQAEEDRLLYVAATRARELLVVSRWAKKPGEGPWGEFGGFLTQAAELRPPASVSVQAAHPLESRAAAQESAEHARERAFTRVLGPSWSITSATSEAHHIAAMTRDIEVSADVSGDVSGDVSADDPSRVVLTNTPSHRADAGQAWGTLVHGLLEHAMRQESATRDDLRRLGMWLTVEEPRLREVLDLAVDTVLQVSKAAFWNDAKSTEHSVETPFAFAEPGNALRTGVIDLMFRQADRWQIVDYKTDVDTTERAAAYAEQLRMYERALAKVGAGEVGSMIQPVRSTSEVR